MIPSNIEKLEKRYLRTGDIPTEGGKKNMNFYESILFSTPLPTSKGSEWKYDVVGYNLETHMFEHICSLRQDSLGGSYKRYRKHDDDDECIAEYCSIKDAMFIIHDELHIKPNITVDQNPHIQRGFI